MPGAGYPEIMTSQTSVVCLKKSISLNRIASSQMEFYLYSNNFRFVSLQSSVCLLVVFSFIFSCFGFISNNSVSNISQLRAFVQNFLCSFYGKCFMGIVYLCNNFSVILLACFVIASGLSSPLLVFNYNVRYFIFIDYYNRYSSSVKKGSM
ncbi:MAG: hypothetical protein BWY23_00128 [Spirochaetes bacterium ADurb.Bin218]|nr:MAG: hypothetical protein BWY23_00128 [Spirochaetes bacterium ADurb.Bin218]